MPKQIQAVMLMHQINTDYLTVCFIIKCKMLKFTILHNGIYKLVVSDKVRHHRIKELKYLFFNRMPEKKSFFKSNELIKSNYEFACKVISAFF